MNPDPEFAPGPRGLALINYLWRMRSDRLGVLRDATSGFGENVRFTLANRNIFFINSPDGIRHVLHTNAHNYSKGIGLRDAKSLLGSGLLTSDWDDWKGQRRLLAPYFEQNWFSRFDGVITEIASEFSSEWLKTQTHNGIDVSYELSCLTLCALGRSYFSFDFRPEMAELLASLREIEETSVRRMISVLPVPVWAPTLRSLRLFKAIRHTEKIIDKIIQTGMADGCRETIVHSLVKPDKYGDPGAFDKSRQARDEIATLILAGHETTSAALSWTIYLLCRNPGVESALRRQIKKALGERAPTLEDLTDVPLAKLVVQESLRLYPPVWLIPRRAEKPDVVCGYTIPQGADVLISPYIVHRHPAYWTHPEDFDPYRFAEQDGKSEKKRLPFVYLPFGVGQRNCIGARFAMMEVQLILISLLQNVRFDLVQKNVTPDPQLTLKPGLGLFARISRA